MNDKTGAVRRQLILPSQASEAPELSVWLAALNDCRARTEKAISNIQQDELDWVCPFSRNTIGTLLYHIAAIELDWLYSEILEREFPDDFRSWFPHDVRDSEGNLTRVIGDSPQKHENRLRYVRDRLADVLRDMTSADFKRVRHLQPYDVTPEWVVCHLLQHEAEHRGQIAVLRDRFKDANAAPSN